MMKKCLSMILAIVVLLCLMPTTEVFASLVMMVDIDEIDLPVAGNKPDLSATLGNDHGTYKITRIEWVEYDEGWEFQRDMTENDTFIEGYWYTVFVTLETTSGNTFGNSVAGTINNENANMSGSSVHNNGTKVCFYTAYQATRVLTEITNVDLTVVMPVVGKTPTFAKVDTDQYFSEKYGTVSNCSNGVTWTNESSGVNITVSNPFKEGTTYKVTYYLTAKDGYKFTGSTVCTINGIPATFEPIDHFHIKVSLGGLIPDDGKEEITSIDLSVQAPKEDERPSYTKIDGTGYFSDNGIVGASTRIYKNGIAWYETETYYLSPGTTDTFVGGKEYTVKIMLTAKEGYKFGKSLRAQINGVNATVEYMEDGSIQVIAKLTAAKKEHTHTVSGWRTTQVYHYQVCTTCGEMLEQEDHKGGVATCSEKGTCSVCGYAYLETNEDHHPDTSKWVACGDLYHAYLCKDCGAHCTPEAHVAGPVENPDAAVICKECGYVMAPAKEHTHNLTKVAGKEATCTEPGNVEYYTCDGCSDVFADKEGKNKLTETAIAPLGHTASDGWQSDENNHWRTCAVCNIALAETQTAHQLKDGKCTDCGYEAPKTENPPSDPTNPTENQPTNPTENQPTNPTENQPTNPTQTTPAPTVPQKKDEEDGGIPWLALVLIGLGAVGVGVFGGLMILKKKG